MTTSTKCYPWWHAKYKALQTQPVYLSSGCGINAIGNVACEPESMRAAAEAQLRAAGLLDSLSLETYTLARYIQSEIGGGNPPGTLEEAVAVGEAAVNRAKLEGKQSANDILLYRQGPGHPNYGYYGPIHGPDGTTTAPYGRWATTQSDPTVLAVLLADLVTSGQSNDFARGADDQASIQYTANFPSLPGYVAYLANNHEFWVGPLPGVNHWRTFLVAHKEGETASTSWGASRVAETLDQLNADMAANGGARGVMAQPWPTDLPTCVRGGFLWIAGILGVTAGALAWSHGMRLPRRWRFGWLNR